jgi:uncharacterized membrane protein YeaQ/YmgE (transglycosylase-associated protein family)
MEILSWIAWGLFVGAIARLLLPGRQRIGLVWTLLLGVVGSLLGGLLAREALGIGDGDNFDFGSFLIAVAASFVLLAAFERVNAMLPDKKRRDGDALDRRR